MSDNKQFNSIPADDVIRSFLLGRLDVAEQEKFEERLMTDDRLHERVRQAEFQLADDFAAKRIDPLDRQRFLKTFMRTDERSRIVAVSDALRQRFSPAGALLGAPGPRRWRRVLIFNQPAWRLAFGVLLLLLLVGSLWLVTKQPNLVERILPRSTPSRPAANPTPQEAHHPSNVAPPVHRESTASPPGHESTPANQTADTRVVTTLALSPGALNDTSQTPAISLPDGSPGVVRFELAVEQAASGEFQAEVLTNANPVFVGNAKISANNRLELDVPVRALKAGDYEIKLSRVYDGSKQAVANYYFRVR